jgi:hypothetical protein
VIHHSEPVTPALLLNPRHPLGCFMAADIHHLSNGPLARLIVACGLFEQFQGSLKEFVDHGFKLARKAGIQNLIAERQA